MNVIKIELSNFRNYKKLVIDNFSNLNIIIGKNGIGKTSILESIYLGSLAKTFRSSNDMNMIKDGCDYLKIKISLYNNFIKSKVELFLDKNGKKTKINDNKQKKLSDFISQYTVILLSPDELKIIKASPTVRRNYINIQLSQLDKEYITCLNDYNYLIKNKNDYLKKLMFNNNLDTRYLDVIDNKIVEKGLKIFNYRNNYINQINKYIDIIFKEFLKKDNLKIDYVSDYSINDREKILNILKRSRKKDINLGMTTFGVHRDDIEFVHNGKNAKEYSSQGIQKMIVLAMKIAEVIIFIKEYNIRPILLLDDLFSELDNINKNSIFKSLDKNIQIFITTTDINNISKIIRNKAKIFDLDERKINNGE